MNNIEKLKLLYEQSSKHSNYQLLSTKLTKLIGDNIEVKSRHEKERLQFLLKNLDFKNKNILDIGGNTGYFSFELIENGANHMDYIEGNKAHADFVKLASEVLEISEKIEVINKYLNFENEMNDKNYDIILLLNVLHHLGDDYGDKYLSIDKAKEKILEQLNSLANKTSILVFQLGFNWKGDRNYCLFEHGTKKELIDFVSKGICNNWEIVKIGIAERNNDSIVYNQLNEQNIQRDDSMGEFLNRPIFILKNKRNIFDRIKELSFLNNLVSDYKDITPYSNIKKEIIYDLIINSLKSIGKHEKALQLGCSNGYETEMLSKTFNKLTVIDGSSVFIEKLQKLNTNKSITFISSLFEDLDKTVNEKFDVVFCNYILEHVYNSNYILKLLKKVLKKNGYLFAVVPNAKALSRRLAKEMGMIENLTDLTKNDYAHGHRRVYTREVFEKEIRDSGFEIIQTKGIVFKILSDFQLNKLLSEGVLNKEHIWAMQSLAMKEENIDFSDSIFIQAKNS